MDWPMAEPRKREAEWWTNRNKCGHHCSRIREKCMGVNGIFVGVGMYWREMKLRESDVCKRRLSCNKKFYKFIY